MNTYINTDSLENARKIICGHTAWGKKENCLEIDVRLATLQLVFSCYTKMTTDLAAQLIVALGQECGHSMTGFLCLSHRANIKVLACCIWRPFLSSCGCVSIQFLTIVGLKSLFPCWLSPGSHSQYLEAACFPGHVAPSSPSQQREYPLCQIHPMLPVSLTLRPISEEFMWLVQARPAR